MASEIERDQDDTGEEQPMIDASFPGELEMVAMMQAAEPRRAYDKSDEELKTYRRDYLKDCEPKEYRRLLKKGQLDGHLQEKADEAREYAEDLIRGGEAPPQAWHWAIRERLLESERD